MDTWQRRTVYYLLGLGVVMIAYTLAYHYVMTTFEGASPTFAHSLQVVVETFTTTGFGSDAPWETLEANLLVIAMDLTGVVLIFLALPVLLFPLFEETMSTSPPTAVEGLSDHVVICAYSSRVRTLIDELETLDVPYVVVEPDRERAIELVDTDVDVIHGDPETVETLVDANLATARALVADVDDSTNASILLTADGITDDVKLITFVEDVDLAAYHRYAGADHVFSPRQLIGESIANKVTTAASQELGDAVEIDEDFEIVELPVQSGSELAGKRIDESRIRERTGAHIVGAWFHGEFIAPPAPDAVIDDQTVLLVAGHEHQLEDLKELTLSRSRRSEHGRVIVCGYGEVGSTVKSEIEAAGMPVVAVDVAEQEGVDVVGDVTEEATLRTANLSEARTVILTLPDDTMTVFATLVIRELNPEVEIIARADQTESVRKLYQAGADYVLALATVSGRMLASTILGEDVLSFDQQIDVVRFDAGKLAGETIAGAAVRERTGCTIIAIERNGSVLTDLKPDERIQAGDAVVVAGPDESITQFAARYT